MINNTPTKTKRSLTQFEVRAINNDGDAMDVLAFCDTAAEALQHVPELTGETVAWVIERHTTYFTRGKPDDYKTMRCLGDESALRAGGWIGEEVAS